MRLWGGTIVAIVARVHNVGTRATVRPVPFGFEITQQYEPVRFCRRFRLLCAEQAEKIRFLRISGCRRDVRRARETLSNTRIIIIVLIPFAYTVHREFRLMYISVRRRRTITHSIGAGQRTKITHVKR